MKLSSFKIAKQLSQFKPKVHGFSEIQGAIIKTPQACRFTTQLITHHSQVTRARIR